jgi:solute carrier family 25 phosphate transporter 3
MMYELFKDSMSTLVGRDQAHTYKSVIYVASAGCAEAIAAVLMCPWEMLKVQVQTSSRFPNRFGPALTAMIQQRQALSFPFGSLRPLWSRQILGTMANFYTFESTVEGVYTHLLTNDKDSYAPSTQLAVTLGSGYVAGFVSTMVSHPADSLISLKARNPHKTSKQLLEEVGWKNLATKGLGVRIMLTGSIIGVQWFVYDTFKMAMGMGTTGGKSKG